MKRSILLMASVLFAAYSFAQIVVPDIQFRSFLTKNYSIQFDSQGGLLSKNDYFIVDTITAIDVHNLGIETLAGIDGMPHLKSINCADNLLSSIDLSKNVNLEGLNLSGNQISKFDFSKNTALKHLFCNSNPVDSLDLSILKNLSDFWCIGTPCQKINFGQNDSLIAAFIVGNKLTNIDLSGCPGLKGLACNENKLTQLDVSKNSKLEYLGFGVNEIDKINLSGLSNLRNLECSNTKLTSLDVSSNPLLNMINCSKNKLKKIDVSNCKELFYFDVNSTDLTTLDIRNNKQLNTLNISLNRKLTRCYVSKLPYPTFNIFVKSDSTPVNYYLAGDRLLKMIDRIYDAPTAFKSAITDSIMGTISSFPLIEGDTLTTFIYRGQANSVQISGDAFRWATSGEPFIHIPETDFWFLTQNYENDARLDYKMIVDGNWILDPFNSLTCAGGFGNNSELRMPKYIVSPETEYYAEIPHGKVVSQGISSANLNNSRTIKIYLPPTYSFATKDSFPLAIFHDGLEYLSLANANNTLDYLIENKRIRPIIGVFIPPVDRPNEYRGTLSDKFVKFISEELLPIISAQYRVLRAPKYRASIGISNGGDISQHLGFKISNKIGNVGSFSAGGYWYNSEYYQSEKLPLKFYIDAGTYDEVGFLQNNQNLVDIAMKPKGYDYQFNIFHEGHSWGNWKAHLHFALEYFFPYSDLAQSVEPILNDLRSNSVGANYPNPFRLTTTIRYNCATTSLVKIVITDATGRTINTLVNKEMDAGTHEVEFSPTNASNGIYFATIFFGSKKMNTIKLIQLNK
ncbi:MAG: alpha/beta hydrolase-fold protein [Bacteroidales bacterium]